MQAPPRRVACVVRVSGAEQARGHSPEQQEAQLRAWAGAQGHTIAAVLADVPISSGVPLARRPQGSRLAGLLASGECDAVAATRLDRAFRDVLECLTETYGWLAGGVAVYFLDTPFDLNTSAGRMAYQNAAVQAEYYRNQLRERIRDVMGYLHARGIYTTRTPLGYQRVPRAEAERRGTGVRSDLVPGPRADLVRELFRRVAAGEGPQAIAQSLNRRGEPGPAGPLWEHTSVYRVVTNRTYIGRMTVHGREVEAVNVEPLVDLPLWLTVQHQLGEPERFGGRTRHARSPLAGLLVCGKCGARYYTGGGPGRDYCGCMGRTRGLCDARHIRESEVLPGLLKRVKRFLSRQALRQAAARQRQSQRPDKAARRRADLTERIARAQRLFVMGEVSEAEYTAQVAPWKAELAAVPPAMPPAEEPLPVPDFDTTNPLAVRDVLRACIERIEVLDRSTSRIVWR